jgi:2-polyprenyl-3-methyl-5-hydroxy-6-metoxy-1,4-benzoquinol methylase
VKRAGGSGHEMRRIRVERSLSNIIAARYDRLIARYDHLFASAIERTRGELRADDRVLDVGCGTGSLCLGLTRSVRQIVAIDIAPNMISVATSKAARLSISNIDFRLADGYCLPFDDGGFDAVVLANVLHMVKEPRLLLAEAFRLVRPGGRLITLTDCYAEPVGILAVRLLLGAYSLLEHLGFTYLNRYRTSDINGLLSGVGCQVTDATVMNAAPVSYYAVGRKPDGLAGQVRDEMREPSQLDGR